MALEGALYYSNGITGSNTKGGRADSSVVIEFNHRVYLPVDPHTGNIVGQRVHEPLVLTKEIDKATPLLYKACCQGETLDELRIDWFRINQTGREEVYFTTTLRRVKVTGVEDILPNSKDPAKEQQSHLEQLQLLYSEIEWTFTDGGVTHVDSYSGEE